jgi:uncharacterized membrane protein
MARARPKKRPEPAPTPVVPRPDWAVLLPAIAGMAVSGYLTWVKLSGYRAALCVAGGGCDIVQASRYALFLGVPTALWGFALYVAIGVLAVLGLAGSRWLTAFVLAAGGVGFSLYLTGLSVLVLGATCGWCLASAVLMIVVLGAVVLRRPRAAAGRKAARFGTWQLAGYGAVSAVAAGVTGAFVFAAPFSAPPGYAVALARHLTTSNAVMYGAFW